MNNEFQLLFKDLKAANREGKIIKNEIRKRAAKTICDALATLGIKSNPSDMLFTNKGIWIEAKDDPQADLQDPYMYMLHFLSEGKMIQEVTFTENESEEPVTLCHKGYVYIINTDYEYMNAENVILSYDDSKYYYLFPGQDITVNGKRLEWTGPKDGFEPYGSE